MFPTKALLVLFPLCFHPGQAVAATPTNCSSYNQIFGPYPNDANGNYQHNSGIHSWSNGMSGSCTYTGVAQVGVVTNCSIHDVASSTSAAGDDGSTAPYWHTPFASDKGSIADSNGPQVTAGAEGAATVQSCTALPCGLPTITFTPNGPGFTVSTSANNGTIIWTADEPYTLTCMAETLKALPKPNPPACTVPNPIDPPYSLPGGFEWVWDVATCQWVVVPDGESPVFVDTKGNWSDTRELFSDPTKGNYVSFDMRGDGVIEKFSWPLPNSGLGWLALPSDGTITNGTQLFGNFTPHSSPPGITNYPNPNGFIALSWYDLPAQGGDENLILDKRDEVWPRLRLWIDEHCYQRPDVPCVSLPQELHTLESMGITSISLMWGGGIQTDAVGNLYKFNTVVNPEAENNRDQAVNNADGSVRIVHTSRGLQTSQDGRRAYDVWLVRVDKP